MRGGINTSCVPTQSWAPTLEAPYQAGGGTGARFEQGPPPAAHGVPDTHGQRILCDVPCGALEHLAGPQLVHAAVADVRPVRAAALHEAQGTRGPRPDLGRQAVAERDDRVVGAPDGEVQETVRIEQRTTGFPEFAQHRANRDFRRARAVGVPAHAVDHREQHRAVRVRDGDAILVFFAMPDEAQVRMLDLQGTLRPPVVV